MFLAEVSVEIVWAQELNGRVVSNLQSHQMKSEPLTHWPVIMPVWIITNTFTYIL